MTNEEKAHYISILDDEITLEHKKVIDEIPYLHEFILDAMHKAVTEALEMRTL